MTQTCKKRLVAIICRAKANILNLNELLCSVYSSKFELTSESIDDDAQQKDGYECLVDEIHYYGGDHELPIFPRIPLVTLLKKWLRF